MRSRLLGGAGEWPSYKSTRYSSDHLIANVELEMADYQLTVPQKAGHTSLLVGRLYSYTDHVVVCPT